VECQHDPSVSFEILLPSSVSDQAQWMEVGVLPGACPSPAQLKGGLPDTGPIVRVAFQKGDASPPAIGDLPKASYAFAAAARGSDCSVLAAGCTEVDVTSARDVSIALTATTSPVGACTAGETCSTGRCAPTATTGNPALGAGCSMQLVGAGPFAVPLVDSGENASTPAVAVTESGFLVAYREYDPAGGAAQLTVAAVDEGGGLSLPAPSTLPAQCAGQNETDGLGLAYLGGAGVVVSARPPCPQSAGAGLDVLQVDAAGNVHSTSFDPATSGTPTLSGGHPVALTGASSGWVAFLDQGAADVVALQTPAAPVTFGDPPQTLAAVAATGQMLALLSGDGTTLALTLGASPASEAGTPFTLGGTWGAVAANASRAYVLGGSSGQTLTFGAFDLGAASAAATATFPPPAQGAIAGGDVAFQGDHVFFAVEQPGAVSLIVYDHASTTPTFLSSIQLASDPRVPSQLGVRDGRVAVAASDSRVLVAWITAASLDANDPVGGYALYACAP
jgi:hypothetical protein